MALTTCPFCHAPLAVAAAICPTCDRGLSGPGVALLITRRLRRHAIRRLIRLLIIASVCGTLAAIATRHARDAVPATLTTATTAAPVTPSAPTPTPAPPAPAVAAAMTPSPSPAADPPGAGGGTLPAIDEATAEPASDASATPSGPAQPATGPGSAWCAHQAVMHNSYGDGDTQYWLFEPDTPRPRSAPVVVFLHGWSAMQPQAYLAWIEHIVKRGSIVIYPRYQASLRSSPESFTANTVTAVLAAFTELERPGAHVLPDRAQVTCVGHSFGGLLAANLAALSGSDSLPPIRAVMAVEPGGGRNRVYQDYATIPSGTLLLCIAGEDDHIAGAELAKRIIREATAVAASDKDYILMRSDHHGDPALVANHFAPAARTGCGCWFGLWKWFDALQAAADRQQDRDAALGSTARQRFMGTWSDGQAVIEPLITATP